MKQKQQDKLRSLLKKYKCGDAGNQVRQCLGINFDNFLQKADPLYALPRIASCYFDEKKRRDLGGVAYKEWLKDVVEQRWVEPINQYSDEHGERTVLQAIYYLIDNNLWETYEGRLALDSRDDEYYKLSDMPSAIAIVLETETKEKEEVLPPTPTQEEHPGTCIMSAEEAIRVANGTDAAIGVLIDGIHKMTEYVRTAADTEALHSMIAAQGKQLEDYRKRLSDCKSAMDKASGCIAKLKEEAKQAQEEYDELNEKWKKAICERDDADRELEACKKLLDEEVSKEQMPKRKVIPQSVIEDVPLLGRGVMKGLIPVLARYNVVIDPNR